MNTRQRFHEVTGMYFVARERIVWASSKNLAHHLEMVPLYYVYAFSKNRKERSHQESESWPSALFEKQDVCTSVLWKGVVGFNSWIVSGAQMQLKTRVPHTNKSTIQQAFLYLQYVRIGTQYKFELFLVYEKYLTAMIELISCITKHYIHNKN